jgi:hypothetical protein
MIDLIRPSEMGDGLQEAGEQRRLIPVVAASLRSFSLHVKTKENSLLNSTKSP